MLRSVCGRLVIASNDDRTVAALKEILKKKYRITDSGRLENFLGLKINRNMGKKTIHISQSQFIEDALAKFGFDHCPRAKTPMDPTMDLSVNKEYQASDDYINRFCSMVGTLSWIATWSIPEPSLQYISCNALPTTSRPSILLLRAESSNT